MGLKKERSRGASDSTGAADSTEGRGLGNPRVLPSRVWFRAGVPNLWNLMLDNLRWS